MIGRIIVYGLLVLGVLYWIPLRLWFRRWGVGDGELKQPMAGDNEVPKPNYFAMLAVTIDAPVESVWPWLISRNQARVPRSMTSFLFMLALEPAAFIMTRKMLLGIKRRAEALCRESGTGPALPLPSVRA